MIPTRVMSPAAMPHTAPTQAANESGLIAKVAFFAPVWMLQRQKAKVVTDVQLCCSQACSALPHQGLCQCNLPAASDRALT